MNNCVRQRCVIVLGILAAAAIFVAARARGADLAYVELYDGWAGSNGGKLHGRVHRAKPSEPPKLGESTWGRLMANVSALETNGLPTAEVTATGLPSLVPTTASETGFFTIELPAGSSRNSLQCRSAPRRASARPRR